MYAPRDPHRPELRPGAVFYVNDGMWQGNTAFIVSMVRDASDQTAFVLISPSGGLQRMHPEWVSLLMMRIV
jgi:hypothetical protein